MGTENRRFVYVFIRKDLKPQDQLVQVSHATYESALLFKNHADRTSIIVLGVKDLSKLNDVATYLNNNKIDFCTYTEQGGGLGETAIATGALLQDQRSLFKKFKLFNF